MSEQILRALGMAFAMGWQILWPLILGFTLSGVVQAVVSHQEMARLLPDAYRDDPDASGEFRRYTEQGLRSGKTAAARTVLATLPPGGGRIRLSEPEAQAWLRALNDVRLALGVHLEVTDDFDEQVAEIEPDDPRSPYIDVYQWLAFLQESLVRALS